jgi:hypothetical protein
VAFFSKIMEVENVPGHDDENRKYFRPTPQSKRSSLTWMNRKRSWKKLKKQCPGTTSGKETRRKFPG